MLIYTTDLGMIQFVVHGGYIKSPDGQQEFIPADQVMQKYGLSESECLLVNSPVEYQEKIKGQPYTLYFNLHPCQNGVYVLPDPKILNEHPQMI